MRSPCPMHTDDDVAGTFVSEEVGWEFTCMRKGHPDGGPYTWISPPAVPQVAELGGLAAQLGLDVELPALLQRYPGQWVEYGIVEHDYAVAHPKDWAFLVNRYGHTAIAAKQYTASAFLGSVLGRLSRTNDLLARLGPATGRWDYNGRIVWAALPPAPDWANRLSWIDSGLTMEHVPGRGPNAKLR